MDESIKQYYRIFTGLAQVKLLQHFWRRGLSCIEHTLKLVAMELQNSGRIWRFQAKLLRGETKHWHLGPLGLRPSSWSDRPQGAVEQGPPPDHTSPQGQAQHPAAGISKEAHSLGYRICLPRLLGRRVHKRGAAECQGCRDQHGPLHDPAAALGRPERREDKSTQALGLMNEVSALLGQGEFLNFIPIFLPPPADLTCSFYRGADRACFQPFLETSGWSIADE